MNYQGTCLAVYSPHSYTNVLKVVKHLQAINYSENQLSVMGRRANVKREKSRFLSLISSFNYEKAEKFFWDTLRDLLSSKICFQTSGNYSIEVTGELSKVKLKNNDTKDMADSYALVDSLLYCIGVPEVSFKYYTTALKNGQLLLIIHGNYQELKRAGNLLDLSGNTNVSLHLTNTSECK